MKTKEEQRFDLVCAALSGLCANAHPGIPSSEYGKSAVSFADAAMAELYGEPTVNQSLTVEPDADGWIQHVPGDPMPCDGDLRVLVRLLDGFEDDSPERARWWGAFGKDPITLADYWKNIGNVKNNPIIAWKPAE